MENSKKNEKKNEKKSTNPKEKQPSRKPSVQAKPKVKPNVSSKPKEKQPVTKSNVSPKPNPNFPGRTGKPSGKGRGNNPPSKKMTEEDAKRIREAEERKRTKSDNGFVERATKAAEKNKKK